MDRNDDLTGAQNPASDPPQFEEPLLKCCVRISSRVTHNDGTIRYHRNCVLVKNGLMQVPYSRASGMLNPNESDFHSDDDETMSQSISSIGSHESCHDESTQSEHAYLILRTEILQDAIHGKVYRGLVLSLMNDHTWKTTGEWCAIKEMPWITIQRNRNMAENPRDEMAAMQHFQRFYTYAGGEAGSAVGIMHETKVIVPLDHMYDDQNLYNITPFCAGGDLLDALNDPINLRRNFTEEESRHKLRSILDGLEWLQRAGLCHRDISLENIMIDEGHTVIIDMGMCLRIPYTQNGDNMAILVENLHRRADRCLITRRSAAGKAYCMSPEVYEETPFDGHAIDVWAAGICLYVMLIGIKPWSGPESSEYYFRHMSNGYMGSLLNQDILPRCGVNLSGDAIDLLQRMLFSNPTDRLSLQQVRSHPWMNIDEALMGL